MEKTSKYNKMFDPLRAAYVEGFQEGYLLALDIIQQQSNL